MNQPLFARLLALLFLGAALPALAAQAYVSLSGPGGSVSQFKPTGGAPVRTYATPPGASDMLLSADGNKLYVGTTANRQGDIPGGSPTLVAVLNASTGALLQQFVLPASVTRMVRNAAEDHLYATGTAADGTNLVISLDLNTGQTATAPIPDGSPFALYAIGITPDGGSLFVPTRDAIAVFSTASLTPIASIALPSNGIAAPPLATPDGRTLLASGASKVYAIDIATRSLTRTVSITTSAATFGDALSPDGKTYYVNAGTLSAIDVPTLTVLRSVALGQTNPMRLGLTADGATLYATDLTYNTTAVVDATTLQVKRSLKNIAPPWAVAVLPNGNALILNENSSSLVRVDTAALSPLPGFAVGTLPGAGVLAGGKLFVPESGNMAVQETPAQPTSVKLINDKLIGADSAAVLGNKVLANSGSLVRVIDVALERMTGSFVIRTGANGDIGTAMSIAASGDGQSLLASYVVLMVSGNLVDAGIVKSASNGSQQRRIASYPFAPGLVASDRSGTAAFAIDFYNANQVGRWDTVNNVFVKSATLPGNPSYTGLAVSSNGAALYLADSKGKVDIVDAVSLQWLASVPVGTQPSGIAVSADGTQAVVTDAQSSQVTVLDLVQLKVLGTVDLGAPSRGAVFLN
jgi:YVTN family beta-propeller protein